MKTNDWVILCMFANLLDQSHSPSPPYFAARTPAPPRRGNNAASEGAGAGVSL